MYNQEHHNYDRYSVYYTKPIHLNNYKNILELRKKAAERYNDILQHPSICLPVVRDYIISNYAQYTIRIPQRDRIMKNLLRHGIPNQVHYPIPAYRQPAIKNLFPKEFRLSNTEISCNSVLSLPMGSHITKGMQAQIAQILMEELK